MRAWVQQTALAGRALQALDRLVLAREAARNSGARVIGVLTTGALVITLMTEDLHLQIAEFLHFSLDGRLVASPVVPVAGGNGGMHGRESFRLFCGR